MLLCEHWLLHHHISFVEKFALVPECAVGQMMLACGRANGHVFSKCFIMCPSFIPAGFGHFSFWIRHNLVLVKVVS